MSVTTDYLLDLYTDVIQIEPYLGEDDYGDPNYGPSFDVAAQITGKVRTVIGTDGQEHVSMVQALLGGVFGVTARDRFTLPLRFSSNPTDATDLPARQPTAVAIGRVSDEETSAYEKLFF